MPGAVVDTRSDYLDLARLYLPIAVAVFVIVALALLWAAVRWRARPDDGRTPSRRSEHNVIELGYVGVLVVVVTVLVVATFTAESKVDATARAPALRVDVTAAKWEWRFAYPGRTVLAGAAGGRGRLVVPAGRTVAFAGRSLDVIHDFWIPGVKFQHQLFPGHVERWDLVFARPGTYTGECAWFCGLYHDEMRFTVVALAPNRFAAWLRAGGRA